MFTELLMPLFWFLAGSLTTLAALILLLPRLRRLPRFARCRRSRGRLHWRQF